MQECTDCKFCANFDDEGALICTNPNLPPSQVEEYLPVGKDDAEDCLYYSDGTPLEFTAAQLTEAQEFGTETSNYARVLAWVLTQKQ